jgi:hypothetical protein
VFSSVWNTSVTYYVRVPGLERLSKADSTGQFTLAGLTSAAHSLDILSSVPSTEAVVLPVTVPGGTVHDLGDVELIDTLRDLVTYLSGDNVRDSVLIDGAGNGFDGILRESSLTTGRIGNGVLFDDTMDVVRVRKKLTPEPRGTVMLWMYPTRIDARRKHRLLGCWASNFEVNIRTDLGGVVTNELFAEGTSNDSSVVGATVIQLNQWYHVACTYNYETHRANLYLNGELDSTGLTADDPVTGEVAFGWGNSPVPTDSTEGTFYGILDEMRIYGRELSREEIRALMGP